MSVEKFNPSIRGESIPYLQANRHVVQNITNPECLAVWIYLLSLPADWNIIKEHVQKHFHIGQDKLKKIFAYLNRVKLIEYVKTRRTDGTLGTTEIIVLNGSKFNNGTAELSTKTTTGVKTTPLDNHTCGSELLHIKQNTNKTDNKKSFYENDQKKLKAVEQSRITEKPVYGKEGWKEANQKKPSWAEENKKAPLADVTSQSNSYTPQPKASDKTSKILEEFMEKEKNAPKKTTKLSTGTALQSKIPPRNEPDGQGAAIDAEGYQDNPSTVRGSDGLLEARGLCTFLEKVGLAG